MLGSLFVLSRGSLVLLCNLILEKLTEIVTFMFYIGEVANSNLEPAFMNQKIENKHMEVSYLPFRRLTD
jgi:hypothetical protein